MKKLDKKIILVTGGTSGIGKAMVQLFAKEGASVIAVGRDKEKGNKIEGNNIEFYQCDVTEEDQVISLKKHVINKYGRLDILVNNAGVLYTDSVDMIKIDEWDKTYKTNTYSVMLTTKHFIEELIKTKGNILNNASIDGLQSCVRGKKSYAYNSSKAATIQFTQLVALNYADKGIRVNCLCPGVTETDLFTNRDFSRFIPAIPMGRVGDAEEIAKAALFLISDDASYITGDILKIDGGASIK